MSGTLWMVEEFGRGGIARYAADVADLCAGAGDVRIATTTGGPAAGADVPAEVWFSRVGPAPVDRAVAAGAGLLRARRRVGRGDVAWVPLGIRPRFEAALVRALTGGGAGVIGTVHNRRPHDSDRGERVVARTTAACDVVVVHSSDMVAWARQHEVRAVQLPFPVPREADAPAGVVTRASLGIGADEPVVAMVGTLRPYKGVDDLLAAVATSSRTDVRVLLAGQVPDRAALDARIGELGLGARVVVRDGYLPGGELLDVLDLTDLVGLCYRRIDHSGVAALAASRGVPAVGSDLPGVRDVYGDAARYAPPEDVAGLAAALGSAVDDLPALREAAARLGRAASDVSAAYRSVVAPMLG